MLLIGAGSGEPAILFELTNYWIYRSKLKDTKTPHLPIGNSILKERSAVRLGGVTKLVLLKKFLSQTTKKPSKDGFRFIISYRDFKFLREQFQTVSLGVTLKRLALNGRKYTIRLRGCQHLYFICHLRIKGALFKAYLRIKSALSFY